MHWCGLLLILGGVVINGMPREIYPNANSGELVLSEEQRALLALFAGLTLNAGPVRVAEPAHEQEHGPRKAGAISAKRGCVSLPYLIPPPYGGAVGGV